MENKTHSFTERGLKYLKDESDRVEVSQSEILRRVLDEVIDKKERDKDE